MTHATPEVLLEAAGQGDREAFRRLYEQTAPQLFAVARRILGNQSAAEECLQEAYIKIWRAARDYETRRGSALGWMVRILKNQAVDMVRSASREPYMADADVLAHCEPADSDSRPRGPHAEAESAETRSVLRDALERLEPRRRRCLELAYNEGMTHQAIADALDMPLGTVKTLIRRGLLELRVLLDHRGTASCAAPHQKRGQRQSSPRRRDRLPETATRPRPISGALNSSPR